MPFKIVRNDITKAKADVIVNTANPNPICASGTDLAIYEAAGKEKLLAERAGIGKIARGDIAVELIDEAQLDNKDVWKRANLDRKHFSKIQCDQNYHPKKKTVMALCIALQLTLEQSKDLLAREQYRRQLSHFWNLKILRMQCVMQYHLVEIRIRLELLQEVLQKHFMESQLY